MKETYAMKERSGCLKSNWKDEGNGYFSMIAYGPYATLAYVALPTKHPDVGRDYNDLDPDVNGGLTFGKYNVFGWDYGHASNYGSPDEHIENALEYFRAREKK